MAFRDDREAMRARNEALEADLAEARRALDELKRQGDGPEVEARRQELLSREAEARQKELLGQDALAAQLQRYDPNRLQRKEDAAAAKASPSIVRQVLSVFIRAWVVVVFGMPALFVMLIAFTAPGILPVCLAALALHALLVITIDAFLRRCPSCRRLLAGKMLSLVRDQYDFHVRSWVCVHCKHRWKTESAASSR